VTGEKSIEKKEEHDNANLKLVHQLISKEEIEDIANQDQELENFDRHPPIELGHEYEDRSQDVIAHQLVEATGIARHFRLAHSAILRSLLESIVAITRDDRKNLHKRLLKLNTQVINAYETNRLFGVEAKNRIVDPLVKRLIWGKSTKIDPLLHDAHANIDDFGDAIWLQQVIDDNDLKSEQ